MMSGAPERRVAEAVVAVFEQRTVHSCDADIVTDGVVTGGRGGSCSLGSL